jgi:hypothetical protein
MLSVPIPRSQAIGKALRSLFPWTGTFNPRTRRLTTPTLIEFVHGLSGRRVTDRAVRYWCTGDRIAPIWFREVLRDHLRAKIFECEEALRELDKMPPPNTLRGVPAMRRRRLEILQEKMRAKEAADAAKLLSDK